MFAARSTVIWFVCACVLGSAGPAGSAPTLWSQERVARDASGRAVPARLVRAQDLDHLHVHRHEFTDGRALEIHTDAVEPDDPTLGAIARTVEAARDHVGASLGRPLRGDVRLYLIAVDTIPTAYRFEAESSSSAPIDEIRLAWIPRGRPLWGPDMPEDLADLLFDTLPHEFVHDVLNTIAPLVQDTSSHPNSGTRWFVEGLCEVVAKDFAWTYAPDVWARSLRMRRVGTHPAFAFDDLHAWSIETRPLRRDNRLFGAALALVDEWTTHRPMASILDDVDASLTPIDGETLAGWLQRDLGSPAVDAILRRATSALAAALNEEEARATHRTGLSGR